MDVIDRHVWSAKSRVNVLKDYALSWALYGIWRTGLWKMLVLKGGTCVRKAHFSHYRLSVDLDYNLIADIDDDRLEDAIVNALLRAEEVGPIKFVLNEMIFKEREGSIYHKGDVVGYEIKVPVAPPFTWRPRLPVIKMDITIGKYERTFLRPEIRPLLHPYEDRPAIFNEVRIKAYSLNEVFAEKVRCLFQQPRVRVRDLYDLWFLREHADMEVVSEILPEKFAMKGVTPDIAIVERKKEKYESWWMDQVGRLVRDVPPFDEVWEAVMEILDELRTSTETELNGRIEAGL